MSSTNMAASSRPTSTAGFGKKPRLIFINLAVSNVVLATEFYKAIGGTLNSIYSTEDCSCMVMSETIHVMIMTPTMFKGFCPPERDVLDAKKSVRVLLCMSVENKEDAESTTEIAESKGGRKDPTTLKQMDGMYGRTFEDPDGHVSFTFPFSFLRLAGDSSSHLSSRSRLPMLPSCVGLVGTLDLETHAHGPPSGNLQQRRIG